MKNIMKDIFDVKQISAMKIKLKVKLMKLKKKFSFSVISPLIINFL